MLKVERKLIVLYWLIGLASAGIIIRSRGIRQLPFGMRYQHDDMEYLENGLNLIEAPIQMIPQESRYSELEWSTYNIREPEDEITYTIGFDNAVDLQENTKFRSDEMFNNGTTIEEYGFTDVRNDKIVTVSYTSDMRGYRPSFEILPLQDLIYRRFENLFSGLV